MLRQVSTRIFYTLVHLNLCDAYRRKILSCDTIELVSSDLNSDSDFELYQYEMGLV